MQVVVENCKKVIKHDVVLDNINLSLESGTCYGIKGTNGSGKTMLLRAICGLIKPTQGQVMIDGKIIGKDISFPPSIGALIETPGFINEYTGEKNLKILADINGRIKMDNIKSEMKRIGLDVFKKKYKKYSLGMKQKLGIVAAIMEKPDLIILDEPTNALDQKSISRLTEIIEEEKCRGALVIVASHDKEILEHVADVMFVMENGQILERVEITDEKI